MEHGSVALITCMAGAINLKPSERAGAVVDGPPARLSAASHPPSPVTILTAGLISLAGIGVTVVWPKTAWAVLTGFLWFVFLVAVAFKAVACRQVPAPRLPLAGRAQDLPHYTLIIALRDEAAVVSQLIKRLSRIDYPRDRLRGYLVVEADDPATLEAIRKARRPTWLQPIIAPPGMPRTKPRALNVALALAEPGLLTVYDAEDDPDPGQLREAAERFARAPADLACLQAPLRIDTRNHPEAWLGRQFALEYAAQFDVMLPALTRLGLPFPLGGTSNHFRVDALKEVGGWDPWNVTEDADLGFRLARFGYREGLLTRPTWESPPPDLKSWIPQRTRWLKGYLQTLSVQLRRPWELGWVGVSALLLTLGTAIAAAVAQGVVLAWMTASLLLHGFNGTVPLVAVGDASLICGGWLVAALALKVGSRRAGVECRLGDLLTVPAYWSLNSIAAVQAIWRLVREPYHWDKTDHVPDRDVVQRLPRTLRIRDSLPTLPVSPIRASGPWKISILKRTPTSAPASSSATELKTSRVCERPDA